MLIGVIGVPSSGKTTVAARVFAELKESGVTAEFISEEARKYIAELRFKHGFVNLKDTDQAEIARRQICSEALMQWPGVVVVADSSVLNAALYMSDDYLNDSCVQEFMTHAANRYDLIFVCAPVPMPEHDINRVHNSEQVAALEGKIDVILEKFGLLNSRKVVRLGGSPKDRFQAALSEIYSRLAENVN